MSKNKERKKPGNALAHGYYSTDVILPWESKSAFRKLHKEMLTEFKPAGAIEQELVHDLTRISWYKRRVVRAGNLVYRADPLSAELEKAGITGVNNLRRAVRERREELGARGTFDTFTNALAQLSTATFARTLRDIEGGQKEAERMQKILQEIHSEIKKCVELEATLNREQSVFERAYIPERLEQLFRIEALLDSRFQKTLQRLLAYQEYRAAMQKSQRQLSAA
jgi:hypothetical protein